MNSADIKFRDKSTEVLAKFLKNQNEILDALKEGYEKELEEKDEIIDCQKQIIQNLREKLEN